MTCVILHISYKRDDGVDSFGQIQPYFFFLIAIQSLHHHCRKLPPSGKSLVTSKSKWGTGGLKKEQVPK